MTTVTTVLTPANIDERVSTLERELADLEPRLTRLAFAAAGGEDASGRAAAAKHAYDELAAHGEQLRAERDRLMLARIEAVRVQERERQRHQAEQQRLRQATFDQLLDERVQLFFELENWLADFKELSQRRQVLGVELDRAAAALGVVAGIPHSTQTTLAIGDRVLHLLSLDPATRGGIGGTGGRGAKPLVDLESRGVRQ